MCYLNSGSDTLGSHRPVVFEPVEVSQELMEFFKIEALAIDEHGNTENSEMLCAQCDHYYPDLGLCRKHLTNVKLYDYCGKHVAKC